MNKRNASQSSLFLIELIFVIFFFSLTSMLCVQVFVKAHLTGKEAKEESGEKLAVAKPCIFAQQSASHAANAAKKGW